MWFRRIRAKQKDNMNFITTRGESTLYCIISLGDMENFRSNVCVNKFVLETKEGEAPWDMKT